MKKLLTCIAVLVAIYGVAVATVPPRRAIAKNGGVIGIGFWSGAACGSSATDAARAIRHAVNVAGIDHVALGSDFDGDKMAFDATGLVQITEALLAQGFNETEIRKIMGDNVARFLMNGLPE